MIAQKFYSINDLSIYYLYICNTKDFIANIYSTTRTSNIGAYNYVCCTINIVAYIFFAPMILSLI